MPELQSGLPDPRSPIAPSLTSTLMAANSGVAGQWLPGPIELPDYADMVIGKLVLPFGPRRIELTHAPQVVKQLTLNAVFRYDFGYLPNKYVIEGWPNGGDPQAMQQIIAQFGSDPLASIPLL